MGLTVAVGLQMLQAVGPLQDVGLALQGLPKGVAAGGHHVVVDTASREDVHRARLGTRQERGRDTDTA